MTKAGSTFFMALAVATLGACAKDESQLGEKLDKIDRRLASIESRLASGVPTAAGAARGQAAQRPAQPDPNAVYAVPIAGAPYRGPQNAKVTIVEAFEFA